MFYRMVLSSWWKTVLLASYILSYRISLNVPSKAGHLTLPRVDSGIGQELDPDENKIILFSVTDLPELLSADLSVPVSVKEGECLLQALHLRVADVTVRAGLVCHDVHVTITCHAPVTCHVSQTCDAEMREKFNLKIVPAAV